MTVLLALLLALLPVAAIFLGRRLLRKPQRVQGTPPRERTDEHEAMLAALSEWLEVPKIATAIVRSGRANRSGLMVLYAKMGNLPEDELAEIVKTLLSDRNVRRIVADHISLRHGIRRDEAMGGLLLWSGGDSVLGRVKAS